MLDRLAGYRLVQLAVHNSSNEYQDVDVADPEDPTKGPVGGGADLIGTVIGIVKTVVDRMLGRGGPGVATEGEAASAAVEQSPTFVRTLTEADLGTGATVARLQGTVSLGGEKATIHIANIEGKM